MADPTGPTGGKVVRPSEGKEANGAPIKRPSDGKEVKSVAFIQCAGQRSTNDDHLPYCSGFCCTESIKQAMITFSKGKATECRANGELKVKFKDLILNEDTEMDCDMVVLATGQVPNFGPDPYVQLAVDEAEDEKRYPLFNESRCRRRGTRMGACPVRVISFENYSIDTVNQQIKNVDILAFSEPEKSQEMAKGIIEAACDHGADMIVTPCPVCQMNVEVYQDDINATFGTKFNISVVYYSTLMSVAYGRSAKDAALDAQIIPAKKLDELAGKLLRQLFIHFGL